MAAATLVVVACLSACSESAAPQDSFGDSEEIRTVTPTWISDLRIVGDSSDDESCSWSASYPAVPGADALTATLRSAVETRLPVFGRSENRGCSGETANLDVDIDFEFLAAAGDVIGVQLTTFDYSGAGDGISSASYWFDGRTRQSVPSTALIAEDATDRLVTAFAKALSGKAGVQGDGLKDALGSEFRAGKLNDLSFTTGGALVADLDRGTAAVPPAGRVRAVIPAAEATALLSDLGRRAQEQAVRPTNRLTIGDTPAPPPPPAPTSPVTPPPAAEVNCQEVKCVALTFDDGPGPFTAQLLDTLAQHDARATFFVVGQNATYNAALVRRVAEAGHEIGNHSWSHPDLTKQTEEQIREQLSRTEQAVKTATGHAPTLVRPPYGAMNDKVRANAGKPLVLWSVDTEDWKFHDSAKVAQTVISTVKPGDIVLIHDIHQTSVAAVPAILNALKERDYHFVTTSQLFGTTPLAAGTTYSSNPAAADRS
ncbi:Peptidoglycan/xylan/chitin deacetylase, PgdA/CDA1 family [Lentzea aerocolonigenes]|nr:Peptidoglycan/xylan/chitin deacetylase, PgdA/CDA1 family [Lentzea aerocolonigenes]